MCRICPAFAGGAFLWRASGRRWHNGAMLIEKYLAILDPLGAEAAERETERLHPELETLLLAAAGAAKVLGVRSE